MADFDDTSFYNGTNDQIDNYDSQEDDYEYEDDDQESGQDSQQGESISYKYEGENEIDQGMVDSLSESLNSYGISNEQFNELASKMDEHAGSESLRMESETRADPQFAGENFEPNIAIAKGGFREYSNDKLTAVLTKAGIMNNVEVVRLFHKLGGMNKQRQGRAKQPNKAAQSNDARFTPEQNQRHAARQYNESLIRSLYSGSN